MKRIILTFLLIGGFTSLFISCNNEKAANEKEVITRSGTEEQVFEIVEKMPQFPGGDTELLTFINKNIKYPQKALQEGVEGRVVIIFIVNENGQISDTEVVRGVDPSLDEKALRVVNLMPVWIPGEEKGEKVKVRYTIPINFSLDKPTPVSETSDEGDVHTVVEKMPEYPGGDRELMKFINTNVKYPEKAMQDKIEGRVIVNFVINTDGSISDAQIVRGIDPLLDAEALRLVNMMPTWTPGEQKGGEIVRVKYTLPIVFRLQ